jgi:putative Flp pilus-assembly TadE/G-like protein
MSPKDSRGQAVVLTVVFMTVLLGASAMAIDVGTWFHAKRALQAEADAAALAGAEALPESTNDARALALQYSAKNGGDLTDSGISFSSSTTANDTINVHLSAPAPGFFSKLFGLSSVTVSADAAARSDNINAALHVAPIAVNWQHPMLQCKPLPCSDPTEIDLDYLKQPQGPDAAGAFTLIDLNPADNGNAGASTVAGWVTNGFDRYMPLGGYDSVPSSEFNNGQMRNAMQGSIGQVLLFPIYNSIQGSGSNAVYNIIAWVGFHVTGFDPSGNTGKVYGWFTRRISEGIQVSSGQNNPDYGARAVQLVN